MLTYDNNYDIEDNIISCIIQKHSLINEIYVDVELFQNSINKRMIIFFQKFYKEYKTLDLILMMNSINKENSKNILANYYTEMLMYCPTTSLFYEYQEKLIDIYRNRKIKESIKMFEKGKLTNDELLENINNVQNEVMVIKQNNKVTPEEMLDMVRNREKIINFPRFNELNKKLQIKKKTVNVIGARPSEGKSALALNLFCDLATENKCIYFNMEMTEEEVYERMLGIEASVPIKNIVGDWSENQERIVRESASRIYNYQYEVINGSKTINSIRTKVIKEQRDSHVMVFIDYIGYIVGKPGMSDKDRIGQAVRELNNLTKDYDCTIFLVAQINRNGSDEPTMQDLKDSGEIEQTADTIILIHDGDKENNSDKKEIGFLIPKCRGGKRNIRIGVEYDKTKQRMRVV